MLGCCTSSKILCVQGIIPLLLEMLVLSICWKRTQHHQDWYHPSVQIWLVCSLSWTNLSCIFVLRLSAAHDTMINQVSLGTLKFFCTFCREHTEILLKNIGFEQHPTLTVLGLGSSICMINLRAAGENQGGQVNSALCICTRFSGMSWKGKLSISATQHANRVWSFFFTPLRVSLFTRSQS